MEKATFGAGCFWGVEELFRTTPGVTATSVGYMGGTMAHPTYEDVCTDTTGHAEVVQLEYDPGQISYQQLLKLFFENHNPTTLHRQGPDVGSQYRSVIFFHSTDQQRLAKEYLSFLETQKTYSRPIVTEVVNAQEFYPAEEYHQQYLKKRGMSHCHI
jgi:peptide-methionine (S)-S-oxide reductase